MLVTLGGGKRPFWDWEKDISFNMGCKKMPGGPVIPSKWSKSLALSSPGKSSEVVGGGGRTVRWKFFTGENAGDLLPG